MQGTTRALFDALRADIIHCLAMVEALIDFGEGEEIEEGIYDQGSPFLVEALCHLLNAFDALPISARKSFRPPTHHKKLPF
jgi:tRNA U34 5-carboxymethylaminomethyl modifying GTPase MnmE/TrmE